MAIVPAFAAIISMRLIGLCAIDDIVIGPAQDGGYVLLGLKSLHAALFRDIPWSTPAVLDRTLAAADGQRLSVCLLKPLVDIDDAVTLDQQSNIYPFLKDGCST